MRVRGVVGDNFFSLHLISNTHTNPTHHPSAMASPKRKSKSKCFVKGMRYSKKWGCKVPCKSPTRRNSKGGCHKPKKRTSK